MRIFSAFVGLFLILTMTSCAHQRAQEERAMLHQQIGIGHFSDQNYPQALKEFLSAEELSPDNPSIQNNLGLTYFMRSRYDLSVKHLKRAITLDAKFTEARNNLARVYIELQKYPEAQRELDLILKDLTYVSSDKAYLNYGLLFFNQKKFSEALPRFQKSVEYDPSSCIGHSYLGRNYLELQDYERAALILDRAIGLCSKQQFDEPHYYSAVTYYRRGEKQKSIQRLQELLKLYPQGSYNLKARDMLALLNKVEP